MSVAFSRVWNAGLSVVGWSLEKCHTRYVIKILCSEINFTRETKEDRIQDLVYMG